MNLHFPMYNDLELEENVLRGGNMKMNLRKAYALLLAGAVAVPAMVGFTKTASTEVMAASLINTTSVSSTLTEVQNVPKYVFLFIGDGMSYPQFQAASDYLGAISDPNPEVLKGGKNLSFMNFPVAGSATTFDSTSFAPDSASTATSISTGHKTHSGVINMDETKTKSYETIAEKLKEQLGYKIGIITTVNLNHATPAAFYAHQPSRGNYYEISEELIASDFEYFAGGALLSPTGSTKDKTSSYVLAQQAGYKVITTQTEAEKLTAADGKAIIIGEVLADSNALSYENDRENREWALKDYVEKGIEVLDNDNGFFMMVEGGKIDWACHANDAGSTIADTLALSDAVEEAIKFYNEHPNETLIIVTGDHETGGLTIGYAGTNYDTYLQNLQNQKLSYAKYDSDFVSKYKEERTPFETVLKDIKTYFGLMTANDPDATEDSTLVLTDYELGRLKSAYDRTMNPKDDMTQEEYVMYGTYEPLSVTITHILNNKSGISFSSYAHTGLPVAVFAMGNGSDMFKGFYDNTEIYANMAELLQVK